MGKVSGILQTKGNQVFSVEPDVTVYRAIEIMCEKNIGGLLITDKGKLTGIFTERDYARKLILKGKSSKDTAIKELMTPNPITVKRRTPIIDAVSKILAKRINCLPVVEDDGSVCGIVTSTDLLKSYQQVLELVQKQGR